MIRSVLAALALLAAPASASAQSWQRPHAELPSAEQPVRNVPTTGYTLALIWMPEHCRARRGGASDLGMECQGRAAHRFTLHGLWPDGAGPNRWPQYCKPVGILTDRQIAAGIAATPSAQLLQHEWAKHGSCMAGDPVRYFSQEDRLFADLRFPHMGALSRRRGLTVADFQRAFAAVNPGMKPDMMRLDLNKRGWLEEVWLCLGKNLRPRTCPADAGGAKPGMRLKIQSAYRRDDKPSPLQGRGLGEGK